MQLDKVSNYDISNMQEEIGMEGQENNSKAKKNG